jgi:hypothetical protein
MVLNPSHALGRVVKCRVILTYAAPPGTSVCIRPSRLLARCRAVLRQSCGRRPRHSHCWRQPRRLKSGRSRDVGLPDRMLPLPDTGPSLEGLCSLSSFLSHIQAAESGENRFNSVPPRGRSDCDQEYRSTTGPAPTGTYCAYPGVDRESVWDRGRPRRVRPCK